MTEAIRNLLQQHFDTVFAAPDGVAKLRELILTLAMQGKLVAQDPNDPPALELMKEIEAKKQRLVKAGIFRNNDDKLSSGSVCPFELPQEWKWASVQQLGFVLGGKRLPKGHAYSESPTKYRYLTVTNMKNATIIDNDVKYITHETHEEIKKYVISRDDIYITIAGTIGAVGIIPEHCDGMNLTENASRLVFFGCDKLFLVHLLSSGIVQDQFAALTNKMAQPKLSLRSILSTGIPVPPLAEQHRIVARIDQLMARCDALEKLRKEREEKRLAVHTVAIKQLIDSPTGSSWNLIQQHFGELYTVKENVAELRKAILQLAVMGRLVPQDPSDPPASELLKEIEAEKQRLVKAGKIKKPKPLPPIKPEEVPYQLPQGWEWVRFGKVTSNRLGKMLDKSKNRGNPKPYLRNTNVQWHQFVLDDVKEMRFEEDELDEFRVLPGDLLVCEGGEPGRCAIWRDLEIEIYFQKAIHRARPFSCVTSEYLQVCLTNDAGNGQLARYFTGATIKHFPGDKLNGYVIPLPPLPEQQRIVARIDQLMALCDTLDQQIDAATGKQTELLNAVMAGV